MAGVDHFVGLPMLDAVDELRAITLRVLSGMLFALLVVTLIDLVYQRYSHHQKMMMTMQEIKDEYKESEGRPEVKGRIRQLQREVAQRRMMADVPTADVVITNPTHYSVALRYEAGEMRAPSMVAKGADQAALKIREIAKENNVPLYSEMDRDVKQMYDSVAHFSGKVLYDQSVYRFDDNLLDIFDVEKPKGPEHIFLMSMDRTGMIEGDYSKISKLFIPYIAGGDIYLDDKNGNFTNCFSF